MSRFNKSQSNNKNKFTPELTNNRRPSGTLNPNAPIFSPSSLQQRSANINPNGQLIVRQFNDQYQPLPNYFRLTHPSNLIPTQVPYNIPTPRQTFKRKQSYNEYQKVPTYATTNLKKPIEIIEIDSDSSDDGKVTNIAPVKYSKYSVNYGHPTNPNDGCEKIQITSSFTPATVAEEEFVFRNNVITSLNKATPANNRQSSTNKRKLDNSDGDLDTSEGPPTKKKICNRIDDTAVQQVNAVQGRYGDRAISVDTQMMQSYHSYHESTSAKLWQYYTSNRQTEAVYNSKVELRNALRMITSSVFENAGLFIVGSSMNGFGTNDSDMDISLVITCQDLNQKKEALAVLYELQGPLRKCKYIEKLFLIRATVPILKFKDRETKVDCDLNVNNVDGIYNTHLLAMYTQIDPRVRPLGLYIKKWAQKMELHDASKGRLNTYTIILLVIQYLQAGCEPPVLPCLQSRYPQLFHYDREVGEIDMIMTLPWHELRSSNTASLSELLLGFFEYYVDRFDFARMAVSVRNGRPIPMDVALQQSQSYQHLANGKPYNVFVEEPFSLCNVSRSLYDEFIFPRIKRCMRYSLQVLRLRQPLHMIFILPEPTANCPGAVIDGIEPSTSVQDNTQNSPKNNKNKSKNQNSAHVRILKRK